MTDDTKPNPLTEAQRNVLICAVDGLAENYQEECAMHPEEFEVEHRDEFTWDKAQARAHDTLIMAFREDGVESVLGENGYVFDEGPAPEHEPTGLSDCSVNDIVAFLKKHKAETQGEQGSK